jgi:hypothetical protein
MASKRSPVRTLVLRELAKGPRTTEQLAETSGASIRHINLYIKEAGAVRVGDVPRKGQGPRAAVWALPQQIH